MSRRYSDESLEDAADRAYGEYRQQISDAYADGLKVGRMGLGAGLCPQGYCDDERREWIRGFGVGAAQLLTDRKAA